MSDTEQRAGSTVEDLRRHLFETMAALRDKANPMPVDRARAVSEVARTIIESARVEVDAARLNKRMPSSGFLAAGPALPAPADGTPPMPTNGIKSVTRHLIKDDDRPGAPF